MEHSKSRCKREVYKKQAYLKQQVKNSDKQPNLSSKGIRKRKTIKNQIQQKEGKNKDQFSHNCVRLFATPWTAARQASLSNPNSRSLPKPMSIESVMPSNHLILCCPPLLLPSIFPSIRVFSNESAPHIRWPKYWSFSFNISPSNEHLGPISFRMDWLDLLAV